MAGLFKRLLASLGSKKSNSKLRAKSPYRRSLQVESLERRRTMDATISGIVFGDVDASDAQNGAEVGIGGVTVELFRDNGVVGTFEAGVDTLVATTTSSATVGQVGNYSFNVTTAGDYLVRQTPTAGFAQRPAQRTQAVNISTNDLTATTLVRLIDSYDVGAQNISVLTANPITDSVSDASILGTERDITANRLTGAGDFQIGIDQTNNNLLRISTDGGTTGTATIIYDGAADANKATSDGAFAPTIDLTSGGTALGMRLTMRVDANGATAIIRIKSAGGTSTTAAVAIPNAGTPQEVLFPFAGGVNGFTGTADLTQATSVELEITTNADADVDLDQIGTYGQTIETINLANIPAMTIGNLVFEDKNNDGLFAGPDIGIGGVDLQLFNDLGTIGTFEPGTDTAVTIGTATTTTSTTVGSVGQYTFTGLLPGNYIVVVPSSEFGTGQPLANYISSPGATTTDTNNADHGAPGTGGVVFAAVALTAAGEPTNDGDADANTNLTVDLGFVSSVLTLTKTDSPDPVVAGANITYTLTATNTGPSNSTNTVITDTLPTGLTFVSATFTVNGGAAQNATNNAGTVTANVGTLPNGQAAVLTIIATVGSGFTGSTLANTGTVDNDEGAPVTSNANTNVTRNVDLGITKTIVGGATTVGVGGTLTYRLSLTNNSAFTVTGIEVDDDLPAGLTAGALPGNVVAGVAPIDFVWSIPTINANSTVTVDIPVNVATNATIGNAINTATIATGRLTGFVDNTPNNNQATATVAVEPRIDLLVTKDNGVTSVTTGQAVTYTIAVNNSGPSAATNVAVADTLPAGLTFVSAKIGTTDFGTINGQAFTGTIPSIAANTTTTITMIANVASAATGANIANTVTVTPAVPAQETGTRANSATDTDTLNRVVTLNVTKTDSADPVIAGGNQFNYTVVVFNSGSADTPSTVFSDPLPVGIEPVDVNNAGTFSVIGAGARTGTVTYNSNTRTLSANLGTLIANGNATTNSATITIPVRATATAVAGTVTNTASVTSADVTQAVTGSQTTAINRNFDLTLTKADGVDTISSGNTITYTIIVSNTGPSTATNVAVTDTLPNTLTFGSVTATAGTFTNNNGVVSGTIPSIAAGATATVTITATVVNNTPDGTVISNTASVSAADETTTTNNSATATANVANIASLSGVVYLDSNKNGVRDTGEVGIPNVAIQLTGTANNQAVTRDTTTDANGTFSFTNLAPGVYNVRETQPSDYTSVATNAGTAGGTIATNEINTITLAGGANSINNAFGEALVFSKRRFLASSV